jgi:peptide/nickel transport system substrate-binding protein
MKILTMAFIGIILVISLLLGGCGEKPAATTATNPPDTKPVSTSAAPSIASSTIPVTTSPQNIDQTSTTATVTPQRGGILTITPQVSPGGPIGWPPENLGEMANLQQFALEGMLKSYFDGHKEPFLATSWDIDTTAKTITFHLRKGVKFHDGTDFNAQAVKFNWDAQIEAKSSIAQYWESIDVIDDYTVRVNLIEYFNTMLDSFQSAFIVSPTAYEKNGIEWMRNNMVGTGPFKLIDYKRDISAEFVRNPDYWMEGKPYLDGIKVVWISDPLTAAAALRSGSTDAWQIDTGSVAAGFEGSEFKTNARLTGMICMIFDSANADSPFYDKRVRQAVDYAIDKEALVKAKGYGYWKAAYQLPPEGTMAYNPDYQGRHYDPDKAKQLLTEAGYPNGFKWRLVVSPLGTDKDVAAGIQNYLKKVGIDISIEYPVYAKYLEYRQVSTWSGAILMQPCLMPSNFNQFFGLYLITTSGLFKSMARPEGIDERINESRSLAEPDIAKIRAIADQVYEEGLILPLHTTGTCVISNPDIIHDAGFMTNYDSFSWCPWNAWKSQ